MYVFPHQFCIVQENATKPIVWVEPGKLVLLLFPQHGRFFPIRFPFYVILQHVRNTYVFSQPNPANKENLANWFPVISQKTDCMWRTWEIGTHTFPTVWVLFSIRLLSYGVLHHMGNTWVFSSNFPQHSEIHRMGNAWEIGSHTFSVKWMVFFHQIAILLYTSSYGKCMDFLVNCHGKQQENPSNEKSLKN